MHRRERGAELVVIIVTYESRSSLWELPFLSELLNEQWEWAVKDLKKGAAWVPQPSGPVAGWMLLEEEVIEVKHLHVLLAWCIQWLKRALSPSSNCLRDHVYCRRDVTYPVGKERFLPTVAWTPREPEAEKNPANLVRPDAMIWCLSIWDTNGDGRTGAGFVGPGSSSLSSSSSSSSSKERIPLFCDIPPNCLSKYHLWIYYCISSLKVILQCSSWSWVTKTIFPGGFQMTTFRYASHSTQIVTTTLRAITEIL